MFIIGDYISDNIVMSHFHHGLQSDSQILSFKSIYP